MSAWVPEPKPSVTFTADHPYVVAITSRTGDVMFFGRLSKPWGATLLHTSTTVVVLLSYSYQTLEPSGALLDGFVPTTITSLLYYRVTCNRTRYIYTYIVIFVLFLTEFFLIQYVFNCNNIVFILSNYCRRIKSLAQYPSCFVRIGNTTYYTLAAYTWRVVRRR